ncbi:MAG: TonB-dependent receptor [Sphingomonadales bacterium]|nr:TonB-dependent receptor [Sphingomonadales bacterium]MDE2170270.1 TonB-dependent receptor [Sphingomonadales bacterium]
MRELSYRHALSSSTALRFVALGFGLLPITAHAATEPQDAVAPPAAAQSANTAAPADKDIIVTGSRITTGGFRAPTPTTVVDAASIAANAQPNVFNAIAQLPSLQGSTGSQVNTFSTSSGQQGLSSFSLRGVGAIRTLTLLDGQRVVGANVTGVPDISLFPQLLIQRVDVVNGGASASYGSDAVGGVVNFITDTHFKGLKGNIQGGITNYGDDAQHMGQIAYGTSFLNDRLHLIGSVEYSKEAGVGGGAFGTALANGRDWFQQTSILNRGVLNDGSPQYNVRNQVQSTTFTKYGLITAGPLQGIAFDQSGNPFQFVYGSNGVPQRNAAGTVAGCYPGFCIGGDLSGNVDAGRSLQSELQRLNTYGRLGFDIDNRNEVYLTVNFGKVNTHNQPVNGENKPGLTIQCANPFVPTSIQTACTNAGITSFQYGTSNAALGNTQVYTDRRQYRFVLGGKGSFSLGGTDWKYDVYGEHGTNDTTVDVRNILLTQRFNAAIDAISLNGAIVCRDPVARANGCQPLNILGGQPSQGALNYVVPQAGPYQSTTQTQDVASINFSGSPVNLWAGPLSIAFGGEFRHEWYKVTADPYGAGFANTPAGGAYPNDPTLIAGGNNWYAGNYKDGGGAYSVKEGFLEVNLPVLDTPALGKANVNAAARVTDYSTSGTIWAWKVGGTWDLPIDGLRLRGVTSRDVRAPNLSELFAAPVTITLPNFFDPFTNQAKLVIQSTVGNPNLKPEIARNTTFGAALANPSWLPGFNVSFDYYKIKIDGVISSLGANDIVNYCYQKVLPQTCSAFNLNNPVGGNYINVQPFNLASIRTEGFDIEASYRWRNPLGLPGNLTLRGLATHVINYITDTGLPGTVPVDSAGSNLGNTPHWKWLAIQTYENDKFSLLVQERWFSSGTFANNYVVCQPGSCPVSTVNNPTIDYNYMPGAFYVDVGGTYNITHNVTAFFKIDNLTNVSPPPNPNFNNPALYDQIGRVYRAGVRFKF